jgi:hypothetical protein
VNKIESATPPLRRIRRWVVGLGAIGVVACHLPALQSPHGDEERLQPADEATLCPDGHSDGGERPPVWVGEEGHPSVEKAVGPNYPARLHGIGAKVVLEFVVNTAGCAEADSKRVVLATDTAFVGPSWAAVRRTRFNPAQRDGHAVRATIQMPFIYATR